MAALFGHGRLRLYLLALLAESERSGYDIIRELQTRFGGLYSPSAGTVYPRLAKLEQEGLLTRRHVGRRTVYTLTEAGLVQLAERREEIVDLEAQLHQVAATRSGELAEAVGDLRREIEDGAAALRAQFALARHALLGPPEPAAWDEAGRPGSEGSTSAVWARVSDPPPPTGHGRDRGAAPAGGFGGPSVDQLRAVLAIATDAGERIRDVLRDPDPEDPAGRPTGPGRGTAPPPGHG